MEELLLVEWLLGARGAGRRELDMERRLVTGAGTRNVSSRAAVSGLEASEFDFAASVALFEDFSPTLVDDVGNLSSCFPLPDFLEPVRGLSFDVVVVARPRCLSLDRSSALLAVANESLRSAPEPLSSAPTLLLLSLISSTSICTSDQSSISVPQAFQFLLFTLSVESVLLTVEHASSVEFCGTDECLPGFTDGMLILLTVDPLTLASLAVLLEDEEWPPRLTQLSLGVLEVPAGLAR